MNAKQKYFAFSTLLRKEIQRFLRIWTQAILPPAITTALYFVIFGRLIGSRIGDIHHVSYVQYITPGLVMMAVITNAYVNVSSSFYIVKFQRSVEELLVAPIPNSLIVLGYVVGGMVRALVVGAVVIIISLFFTHIGVQHILIAGITLMLSALLFSLVGFINGLLAKTFDDVSLIPTFVLTPLIYLGGVFYSIAMLPPFWRDVSLFNPILYLISAFRYGVLGIAKAGLVMLTQSLANELGPEIRVNAVAPGAILWPSAKHLLEDTEKQQILDETLLKRQGNAVDIAKAVLFFIDNDYVTGQILAVDGGRSISGSNTHTLSH